MRMSKQKLIEDNMNLVYFVIHKYYPSFSKDEDLIQEGFWGLCKAADMYDESKGFKFSTYATKAIHGHLKWYFRRQMKHDGIYSLDKPMVGVDGENVSFGELIADETAEKDFDWVERDDFVNGLDVTNQEIVALLKEGLTQGEIGDKLGLTQRTVQKYVGVIKSKWRKENGKD